MKEILDIINENLGPENFNKKSFTGNVYFQKNNGLDIERSVYNKLLNKYNSAFPLDEGDFLTTEDDLLLVFINEIFVDNSSSWFEKDKSYYLSAVLLDNCLLSMYSEETEGSTEQDIVFAQPWDGIDFVELFEAESGGYIFRFYLKNKTEQIDLLSNRFGTSSLVASRKLLEIFNEIIEYKNKIIGLSNNEYAELKSKIEQLFFNGRYEESLDELNNFSKIYNIDDISLESSEFYFYRKVLSLYNSNEIDQALETIDYYIKKCESIGDFSPYSYELKGEILLKNNQYLAANNCLAYSEEIYEDENNRKDARRLKEESYSKLKEVFLEVPYDERKLIFIGADIYATKSNDIVVLKKNAIPENLNFPIGHPHLNSVYTCHPHKQNFYLPIKDYSEELFMDRINEFSYLLQCLGATSLEISSTKSNSSDQRLLSKNEIDGNIDYKINSAKFNYKGESTENTLIDGKLKIAKKQNFKPVKSPFIPPNLIWYHSDLNWQRLVDQRLNGSIMTHSEIISSSQSENISSHELTQIDAELKLLLPKIGVKYNSDNEINSSSLKTHEWLVTVEFEDIDKLIPTENKPGNELLNSFNLNKDDYSLLLERYKEDVLFMIEDDGIIDDSERKILDRKIKKYNLSEEDAKAIENTLLTLNYTENQLKYIEELKDILVDGSITPIERKMLDRYASKFKISSEMQLKIDSIFLK